MSLRPAGRPRYGVDGFPYVVALTTTAAALLAGGLWAAVRGHRRLAFAGLAAGLAPAVPAALGIRYTADGKFRLRDRMLAAVPWRGDEVVADLGAGAGLLGLGAAARTSGIVHCVDLFIFKDLSANSAERPGGTVVVSDLAHVDDEYAPRLRAAGLVVTRTERVPGTFPPQRLLVAHR